MTKEDAIKFFRKSVAEDEGLSEEDAGAKINKSVEIATELLDPLWAIQTIIIKRGKDDFDETVKMTMVVISMLLQPFPIELRKSILYDMILKTLDKNDKSIKVLGEKMEEYKKMNEKRGESDVGVR